jgi:hypothetical protein
LLLVIIQILLADAIHLTKSKIKEVYNMNKEVIDDSSNDEHVEQVIENQIEDHHDELVYLPLDLIEPDPDQPRRHPSLIRDLSW